MSIENYGEVYERRTPRSAELYKESLKLMPEGVTADYKAIKPHPPFMVRARGSKLYAVDGNEYIDYVLGAGPLILGHGHPRVIEAVKRLMNESGTIFFGAADELVVKLAKKIKERYTYVDLLRFTSSGLEATYHALRLARAYTKREKIARFEGQYHGSHDYLLAGWQVPPPDIAGDPSLPPTTPSTAGIPKSVIEDIVTLPFNDLDASEKIIKKY